MPATLAAATYPGRMLKWPLKRSSRWRWLFAGRTTSPRPCAAKPPAMMSSSVRVSGSNDSTVGRSRKRKSTAATLGSPAVVAGSHGRGRHDDRKAAADLGVDVRIDVGRIVRAQDPPRAFARAVADVMAAGCFPLLRSAAVAESWVDELGLHQRQSLGAAEEVAGALDSGTDHLERQRFIGDFDAAHGSQHVPQHIVVDDEGLERAGHQARQHAGALVDQIGAGQAGEGRRDALFIARLIVRYLRISHAGPDAAREIIELRDLGGGRRQHGL